MLKGIALSVLILIGGVSGISLEHEILPGSLVPNGDFEDTTIPTVKKQVVGRQIKDSTQKTSWYSDKGVLVVMRSDDYCPALKSIIPSTKPNQVLAAMQTSTGSRKIDIFQNISGLIPGQRYQFQFEYIADCSKTTARCQGSVGYNMKTDKNTFSAKMDLQPGNVQTFTRVFFIDSTSMTLEVFAEVTPSVPLCIDNVRIFQSRGF